MTSFVIIHTRQITAATSPTLSRSTLHAIMQ